jgi:hypothetical protein
LEEVATDCDAAAVSGRKEQAVAFEPLAERIPLHPRADARGLRLRVDGDRVEARDVEEHPAVAHVVGGPAVTAAADPDPHPGLGGVTDRVADVAGADGLDDEIGEAVTLWIY